MAVPKKRTTKSTKGQRRSHHALETPALGRNGLVTHRLAKAARLGLVKTK